MASNVYPGRISLTICISRFTILFIALVCIVSHTSCSHREGSKAGVTKKYIDSINQNIKDFPEPDLSGLPQINRLIFLSDSLNYTRGYVESSIAGYKAYFQNNRSAEALEMLENARNRLKHTDEPLLMARVYFYLGQFHGWINNNDLALDYFLKSAENCMQIKDTIRVAATYREIGRTFLEKQNLQLARKYLWQAYLTDMQTGHQKGLAVDCNHLGVLYNKLGKADSAGIFYHRSLQINEAYGTPQTLAQTLNNIAGFEIKNGRFNEAETLLVRTLSICDSIRNKRDLAYLLPVVYANLGIIYIKKEDFVQARNYFERALSLAGKDLDLITLIGIREGLYNCYRKLNLFEEAFQENDRIKVLQDSNYAVNSRQNIMALEMKYNYARLQTAQESRQLRLKLLLVGSAIASVLIILLLILFIQKQRIKVRNSKLQQKILDDQLETRNRELASHVLNMVRVNERKMALIETLREQLPNVKKENQQIVQKVIEGFETDQDATIWKEFEMRFTEVHKEFYAKLSKLNPNLTVNEKRLCAFLLLDMTTKEICSITGQSNRAIELARIRLRKQLGLTNQNVSLSNFLASL